MAHMHSNFEESVLLSLEGCPKNITQEQIKEQLSDMECKLNIMIANYKRSGMGDGHPQHGTQVRHDGRCKDNVDGKDDQLDFQDGSNKASFLGPNHSHILYFWQLMEDNKLLGFCNVCLKNCGVSSEKSQICQGALICANSKYWQREKESKRQKKNGMKRFANI